MDSNYPAPEVPDTDGVAELDGIHPDEVATAGEDDQPQASAGNTILEHAFEVQPIPAVDDDQADEEYQDQDDDAEPADNPVDVEGTAFYAPPAEAE